MTWSLRAYGVRVTEANTEPIAKAKMIMEKGRILQLFKGKLWMVILIKLFVYEI